MSFVSSPQFPILERIEADHLHTLTERSNLIARRRLEDDSDDLSVCYGIPPLPLPTDTFPDVPTLLNLRDARQSARSLRLSERASDATSGSLEPEDQGYQTDAQLLSADALDYAHAIQDLASRRHALFSDVKAEDFRNPDLGLRVRFGRWREQWSEDYEGAFGGLALVQAWEFWARCELAGWDPLRVSRGRRTPLSFSPGALLFC